MEYEVSTDKYFNNSNRGKNLFFNIRGNTENVFRVKRLRCELVEKLNKNSGDKIYNNNTIKHSAAENLTNNNYHHFFNHKQINFNHHDKTARKIQFDCLEVDKNLNIILNDFSNRDMFKYDEGSNSNQDENFWPSSDTNKTFSSLISNALNENSNTNPNGNLHFDNAYQGKINKIIF